MNVLLCAVLCLFTGRCCAEVVVDLKAALGDNGEKTTAAINAAVKSLPQEGGTISFPAGVYPISGNGIVVARSNVVLEGAGNGRSVLRRIDHAAPLLQSAASDVIQHQLVIRNLRFDGNCNTFSGENTASISLYGDQVSGTTISNCEFVNSPAVAVALSGTTDVTIDGCTFRAAGDATGTAVSLTNSPRNITISRNRFLYIRNGIVVDTGGASNPAQHPAQEFKITDNYFDLGWWTLKNIFSGSGRSVHYTANSVSDRNAIFKNLLPGAQQNIRVMPVKQQGRATYSGKSIRDVKARFVTNKVRRGDVVRAAESFAVVAEVQSQSSLLVEEWLSRTEYFPVAAPKSGTPYTTYGIFLGQVRDFTENKIVTARWWDFDGNSVTPPTGTQYEVLVQRPNYALHAEAGVSDITVSNNIFKRGWSDQISAYGNRAIITNNVIEDGEDMGITLHGSSHHVANNRISHQGAGGIWANANDSVIEKNQITDSQWVNNFNDSWLGDIMIDDGNRNVISENKCERVSSMLGYNGIVIAARKFGSKGNVLRGNSSRGHLKSDIRFTTKPGAKVSDTVLDNNQGKVVR